jgi:hypothetical protein
MLPDDSAARKLDASKLQQGRVDQHFEIVKPEDKPIPYSDVGFREAAIQWLVQTDQVRELNVFYLLNLINHAYNSQFRHLNIPHSRI